MAMLRILDEEVLSTARVSSDPFDYLLVENAVRREVRAELAADLPVIRRTGSHAISKLSYGRRLEELICDLRSASFQSLMERKFAIDLGSCRSHTTIRGWAGAADGNIHTDLKRKVLTLLLYLNTEWPSREGSLRLLRSPSLDDFAVEVPPLMGNLLIFRRSDRSWHGHTRYYGPRTAIQHNWMKSRLGGLRAKLAIIAPRH